MRKEGFQGCSNPFEIPMNVSIPNSVGIVRYHLIRAEAHKGDSPLILAMYNDFSVPANQYIDLFGDRTGDKSTQVILTDIFKLEFKDMSKNLKKFNQLTLDVLDVDSDDYRLIWGFNRNRFYKGSYESRLAALAGLAKIMADKNVPLGATAVLDYRTDIINKHNAQQVGMDLVGNDTGAMYALNHILTKKLNKNRGVLFSLYGDDDDCEDKVKKFYPLNLLGSRSEFGHNQLIVPHSDFRRVCIHLPKEGETLDVLATGGDAWIALGDNANNPITSGFLAKDGVQTKGLKFDALGDITKKFIMATNVSLSNSCDLILNINKAKK